MQVGLKDVTRRGRKYNIHKCDSICRGIIRRRIASSLFSCITEKGEIVAEKMKELELARLDRQIAEERQRAIEPEAIKRLTERQNFLFGAVFSGSGMHETTYYEALSQCIFCGAEGEEGLEYHEEIGKDCIGVNWYVCRSCGVRVDI